MAIYQITAYDCGEYQDGEIIDFCVCQKERGNSEVLKEWGKKENRKTTCFFAKEVDQEYLQDLRSELLKEVRKKSFLIKRISDVTE